MISHLDHLVLTTVDEAACVRFYVDVLGMQLQQFGEGRKALRFGQQKINLHAVDRDYVLVADAARPGSLDLCFITSVPLEEAVQRLRAAGVTLIEGPILRTGATGAIRSVYVRDPDRNLVEISEPVRPTAN